MNGWSEVSYSLKENPFKLSVPERHRGKDHSVSHQAAQRRDGELVSLVCYFCSSALLTFGLCIFEKDEFSEPI